VQTDGICSTNKQAAFVLIGHKQKILAKTAISDTLPRRKRTGQRERTMSTREEDKALRRLAIQIAVQLPDRREDALTVLRYAETIVLTFLDKQEGPGEVPRDFSGI
jgi:hypothetical protein